MQISDYSLIFVDYEKAFDTIDHTRMLQTLADCIFNSRYIGVIKHVYDNASGCIKFREDSSEF